MVQAQNALNSANKTSNNSTLEQSANGSSGTKSNGKMLQKRAVKTPNTKDTLEKEDVAFSPIKIKKKK